MNKIALAYTNVYPLPTLTFEADIENILDTGSPSGGILDGNQFFYFPIYYTQSNKAQSVAKTTLRGRYIKHVQHRRIEHIIKISADELSAYTVQNGFQNNQKYNHLLNYFNADYQYLAYKNDNWSNYIPVVIADDDFKPDYIKNNIRFPEIELQLLEESSYG